MLFMKVVSWYDDDSFQMLEVPTVGNSSIVMDFHFVANICRQHLSPTPMKSWKVYTQRIIGNS